MKNKTSILILICLIIMILCPQAAFADGTFKTYTYNVWGEYVPSPAGYVPERLITGKDLGTQELNNPTDFFVDAGGDIYILDSGNSRIVVMDSSFKLKRVIDNFKQGGQSIKLNTATGLCVTKDGKLYIADKEAGKVVIADQEGNITGEIVKPEADIIPADFIFKPAKVAVDKKGSVHIISEGSYRGILSFDYRGIFHGFFGSNKVQASYQVISDMFWKKLFTKKQKESMVRTVPIEYSNMDIDSEDFIFTVTANTEQSYLEIKKLNPRGDNILKYRNNEEVMGGIKLGLANYGELEVSYEKGRTIDTKFVDIKVDDKNFINALDQQRGRIFQYDQESNLICIFGGKGDQFGTFKNPVAVECLGDKILVLDSDKANITVFRLAEFAENVREALLKYRGGLYEEAAAHWREVLKTNANYDLAYSGIGKAYLREKNYAEAMKYFKLGYDRKGYDEAYTEHRKDRIRSNFWVVMLGIALLLGAVWFMLERIKRRRGYTLDD